MGVPHGAVGHGRTRRWRWKVAAGLLVCGISAGLWWAVSFAANEDQAARADGIALMHPEIADDPATPGKLEQLSASPEAAAIRGELVRMMMDWTPGTNLDLYADLPMDADSPSTLIPPPSTTSAFDEPLQNPPASASAQGADSGSQTAPVAEPAPAPSTVGAPPEPQLGPGNSP